MIDLPLLALTTDKANVSYIKCKERTLDTEKRTHGLTDDDEREKGLALFFTHMHR